MFRGFFKSKQEERTRYLFDFFNEKESSISGYTAFRNIKKKAGSKSSSKEEYFAIKVNEEDKSIVEVVTFNMPFNNPEKAVISSKKPSRDEAELYLINIETELCYEEFSKFLLESAPEPIAGTAPRMIGNSMLYLTKDPATNKTIILASKNKSSYIPNIADVKAYLSLLSRDLIKTKERQEQLRQIFNNPLINKDGDLAVFVDPESKKEISIQNNDGTFEVFENKAALPHLSSAVDEAFKAVERYIDQETVKASHRESFTETWNENKEVVSLQQSAKDFHRLPGFSIFRSKVGSHTIDDKISKFQDRLKIIIESLTSPEELVQIKRDFYDIIDNCKSHEVGLVAIDISRTLGEEHIFTKFFKSQNQAFNEGCWTVLASDIYARITDSMDKIVDSSNSHGRSHDTHVTVSDDGKLSVVTESHKKVIYGSLPEGDADDPGILLTPEAIIDVKTLLIVNEESPIPLVSLELQPTHIETEVRRYDPDIAQDSEMADYIRFINRSYQKENDFAKSAIAQRPSSVAELITDLHRSPATMDPSTEPDEVMVASAAGYSTPKSQRRPATEETPGKFASGGVKRSALFKGPETDSSYSAVPPDDEESLGTYLLGDLKGFLDRTDPLAANEMLDSDSMVHKIRSSPRRESTHSPLTAENLARHDEVISRLSMDPELERAPSRLSLRSRGVGPEVSEFTQITPAEIAESLTSNNSSGRKMYNPASSDGSTVKNHSSPSVSPARPERRSALKPTNDSRLLPLIVTMIMVGML